MRVAGIGVGMLYVAVGGGTAMLQLQGEQLCCSCRGNSYVAVGGGTALVS